MDTDQQVRLNFLEESVEYFEQIEEVLLGLEASETKPQQLDIALRAAHSIKGSAGMMGFTSMATVAHRLEDFFKILRARQIHVDSELETLFLRGIDCLKEIRNILAAEQSIDEAWLNRQAQPIFDQLQERLGELSEEDEDRLLSGEEEVDVALMIFNSGVEEVLTNFEAESATLGNEALRQSFITTVSQLSNLGLMGEIDPFVELCASIQVQAQTLDIAQIHAFVEQSLQVLQRSQSLVLIGRVNNLPTQVTFKPVDGPPPVSAPEAVDVLATDANADDGDGPLGEPIAVEPIPLGTMPEMPALDLSELEAMQAQMEKVLAEPNALDAAPAFPAATAPTADLSEVQELSAVELAAWQAQQQTIASDDELVDATDSVPDNTVGATVSVELAELQDAIAEINQLDLSEALDAAALETKTAEEAVPIDPAQAAMKASKPVASPPAQRSARTAASPPRTTVAPPQRSATLRISAEDLRQVNTLFSTLILERNTINLRQQQLTGFAERLQERMHALELFNLRLRQWYDRASMEGLVQPNRVGLVQNAIAASSATEDFDTLEMDQYSELHLMAQEQMETVVQLQEVTADILLGLQDMGQATQKLNSTTRSLQARITRTQMRPFSEIVGRFPRVIRDLSLQYNKQVDLRIEGETTLFERVALDALTDPLNHLLRNCFDHGIEPAEDRLAAGKPPEGIITIRASQRGNQAQITIIDDGRGIDLDKIRAKVRQHDIPEEHIAQMSERELLSLIFDAGFSTAEKVTELSGRGVGMDVVRTNLEKLKGDIQVETKLGEGSTFTITLPLSLSVIRIMLLEQQKMAFAVPVDAVTEMLVCQEDTIIRPPHQQPYVNWKDQQVPLTDLDQSLTFRGSNDPLPLEGTPSINQPLIVIINDSGRHHALLIDRFWNEQEVAIRPVMSPMPMPLGFSGTTVLGNGRVIPLVDLVQLVRSAAEHRELVRLEAELAAKQSSQNLPSGSATASAAAEDEFYFNDEVMNIDDLTETFAKQAVLVIDDSVHVRRYLTMTLEKAGYDVEQARDGQEGVDKLLGGLKVNAVLCDVEMPRLDGYGVLDEIKSRPEFSDLPITMLTSRNSDKHRKLAMNLGASAYFSKPYNDQALLKALEDLIEESRSSLV